MGRKELDTASIDNTFKESCYKEKQRNGVIGGGDCGIKQYFYKMGETASCLYVNGNNSVENRRK